MAKANRLALLVLVVLSLAAFAAAQSYTVTDLGPGLAYAINSLGDVTVTMANTSNGDSFVWAPDGSILTLPPLPGDSSAAPSGINSQGLVAGFSATQSSNSAVLWTNGVPLDLGTLGGTNSEAFGINASGEVAGSSDLPVGHEAFRGPRRRACKVLAPCREAVTAKPLRSTVSARLLASPAQMATRTLKLLRFHLVENYGHEESGQAPRLR